MLTVLRVFMCRTSEVRPARVQAGSLGLARSVLPLSTCTQLSLSCVTPLCRGAVRGAPIQPPLPRLDRQRGQPVVTITVHLEAARSGDGSSGEGEDGSLYRRLFPPGQMLVKAEDSLSTSPSGQRPRTPQRGWGSRFFIPVSIQRSALWS